MERIAKCAGCGEGRWAPRCPEACHGWALSADGRWTCPKCPAEQQTGTGSGWDRKAEKDGGK